MRTFLLFSLFLISSLAAIAQSENPKYNKSLADSLGSDDYGMKQYVLVILKTGSNKTADKQTRDSLFRGHMANINRLAQAGQLIVAGPLKANQRSYEGIFIFNVKTIEEGKQLLSTDPAFKAKLLDAELFEWYGSAALPLYLKSHELVEKKKF
jgi:uncharacterized protein YciI